MDCYRIERPIDIVYGPCLNIDLPPWCLAGWAKPGSKLQAPLSNIELLSFIEEFQSCEK